MASFRYFRALRLVKYSREGMPQGQKHYVPKGKVFAVAEGDVEKLQTIGVIGKDSETAPAEKANKLK